MKGFSRMAKYRNHGCNYHYNFLTEEIYFIFRYLILGIDKRCKYKVEIKLGENLF